MATTYTDNGGGAANGSDLEFTYTFPVLQTEDVKVALNSIVQATTKYAVNTASNPTKITFNNTSVDSNVQESSGAPKSGVTVRVFRQTNVGKTNGDEDPKAVFAAGSSIRAIDLNANQEQALYAIHELQDQPIFGSQNIATTGNLTISGNTILGDSTSDTATINALINGNLLPNPVGDHSLGGDTVRWSALYVDSVNTDAIRLDSGTGKLQIGQLPELELYHNQTNGYIDNNKGDLYIRNNVNSVDGGDLHLQARVNEESIVIENDGGVTLYNNNAPRFATGETANFSHIHLKPILDSTTDLGGSNTNRWRSIYSQYLTSNSSGVDITGNISVSGTVDGRDIATDGSKLDGIDTGAKDDQTASEIKALLQSDKLTASEIATGALDGRYFTETESDARYFNISSGDTIKDGDTWPGNDTTIATTEAIDDRIIDLVDDVGGFVPIANETSFPTANPDINDPATGGTVVSVGVLASSHQADNSLTGTVTITDGAGSGNDVTITHCGSGVTLAAGFGILVETTSTLHTYKFHRLTPKATEVTTVAGKATEIGRLGTADAVADMALLGTTDVVADMNLLAVSDVISDMNALAVSDVIADMDLLAVSDVISDMNDLATSGNITAMSTCSTNISSITNAFSNIASIDNFGEKYQIASSDPSTDGGGNTLAEGDLYFNTTANELKVYNGGAWQGGVTASGNFASTTGNTFTGDNRYNDNVKATFGTGSDLKIYHDGSNSIITAGGSGDLQLTSTADDVVITAADNFFVNVQGNEIGLQSYGNGTTSLYYDNSKKFETTSTGATVTGSLFELENSASTVRSAIKSSGSNSYPTLRLENDARGYDLQINGATDALRIYDNTASSERLRIDTSGNVQIPNDSGKLQLGTSQDLQIYHNGNSEILSTDGFLRLSNNTSNGIIYLQSAIIQMQPSGGGEVIFDGRHNGSVSLYYDNSKKLETTSSGVTVSGSLKSNHFIANAGAYSFMNAANSETLIYAVENGAVQLYYNNVKKLATTATGIKLDDNTRIGLGNNEDLQISHNGSDSFVRDLGTGGLYLTGSVVGIKNSGANENGLIFTENGAVELFYDGSKKLSTNPTGIVLDDNTRIGLGNTEDLKIYHDGSNSVLRNGTGNLYIQNGTSGSILIQPVSNENSITSTANGAVELFYDNVKKLQTTAFGVHFNAAHTFMDDGYKARYGASDDLQIYHSGSWNYIDNIGTKNFVIRVNGTDNAFVATPDGEVQLFYDGVRKFRTHAAGTVFEGDLNGGDNAKLTLGNADDLQIIHNGFSSFIQNNTGSLYIGGNTGAANTYIRSNDGEINIAAIKNGAVELFYDNSKKLETRSDGVDIHGLAEVNGHVRPNLNNTHDLGTSSLRWRNVYTNDLHLSNEGSSNDVDGTWGNWTIQEGESDLFLKNNRSGKKYKFNLTEVS